MWNGTNATKDNNGTNGTKGTNGTNGTKMLVLKSSSELYLV
jgi:hypothetical protein